MWWHSFLPSLTLSGPETTQRDQATKYRRTKNAKYKIPRWQQIQNTNYRAGNKYKIRSWQQNRTGSITIPWPCSLPSWAASGVPLTLLPKQSAQSILQFTNRFENTLTIAITNKGSNDTTIVPNIRGVLLTRVPKLMVICLSISRCKYKTRSRCKCKTRSRCKYKTRSRCKYKTRSRC